jgi:hypothetical protein
LEQRITHLDEERRILVDESEIAEQIMEHAKSTGNPNLLKILSEGLRDYLPQFKIVRPSRISFRVIAGGLKEPPPVQTIQQKKSAP